MPDRPAEKPCEPRRRRRRWLMLLGMFLLCAWFGRFAHLRITLRPTPRPDYWEAQVAALDPPPPEAIPVEQAQRILDNRPFETDPAITAVTGFDVDNLRRGEWTRLRADVAAADAVFQGKTFRDARQDLKAALEAGWRPVISLDPRVPNSSLSSYRTWARWLVAHARWARERGDTDEMIEDWQMTCSLARQARRQQALISWVVEGSIHRLLSEEILLACNEGLERLEVSTFSRSASQVLGPIPAAWEILEGIRLSTRCRIEFAFVRAGGSWIDLSEAMHLEYYDWNSGRLPRAPSRLWNLASPLFSSYRAAVRRCDEVFINLGKCRDIAAAERLSGEDGPIRLTVLEGDFYSGPGEKSAVYARMLSLCWAGRVNLEAALASLALNEYRWRFGRYPEALEDLVPELLDAVPVDLVDRQPLRYRRTEDGYLLYSIGFDGKDDAGAWDTEFPAEWGRSADVVFSRLRRRDVTP